MLICVRDQEESKDRLHDFECMLMSPINSTLHGQTESTLPGKERTADRIYSLPSAVLYLQRTQW